VNEVALPAGSARAIALLETAERAKPTLARWARRRPDEPVSDQRDFERVGRTENQPVPLPATPQTLALHLAELACKRRNCERDETAAG
jgi:hypothetical protein